MKKNQKGAVILGIILISLLFIKGYYEHYYDTTNHIIKEMKEYLNKKYKEKFVVLVSPIYDNNYYEGIMYPLKYVGTLKERDRFYKTDIIMKITEIPLINIRLHRYVVDNYGEILIKNELEKKFKEKLEPIFGKNILVATQLEGVCVKSNIKEELKRRERNGIKRPLNGGIYIFGRVENEKDREKYREGIYEFIQYLKQEGMFEYCNIWVIVVDERFLSKNFNIEEFIEKYNADTTKTKENYRKERRELIKKYDNDFKNTSEEEKKEKMENLIKSDLYGTHARGMGKVSGQNELLIFGIFSPKFLNRYSDSKQYWINKGAITNDYNGYNSLKEVKVYKEKY